MDSSRAGDYTVVPGVTQDGRQVYQKGSEYLYFWAGDWLVGPDFTLAGIKSTSDDKKTNLGDAGTIKRLLDDAAISVRRPPTAHHAAPR